MKHLSIVYCILMLVCYTTGYTQEKKQDQLNKDSLQNQIAYRIKEKFPRTRILNIEYEQSLGRSFNSELFENAYLKGEIVAQRNLSAAINLPVYRSDSFIITASGTYDYHEFKFENITPTPNPIIFEKNGIRTFTNFSTTLRGIVFSTLFNKPVVYNGAVIADGTLDGGYERIKGLAAVSLILTRNARTTLTIGAITFIDPTSQIPFFPTFTYTHRFKNSAWEFDFILPQRLYFRRAIGEYTRLSLGSTFGSSGFYADIQAQDFAPVYEYSQLEIKSGVLLEHKLNKFLILTARAGLQHFISNRLTEKGEPTGDFIYRNTQDPTAFFRTGLSIDPSGLFKN